MWNSYKNIILAIVIVLLLPYVITTLFKGGIDFVKNEEIESTKKVIINDNQVQLELDIEQYIVGVVASQIPMDYEREAIKAQSVIARTSVVKKIGSRKSINTSELHLGYMNIIDMEQYWGYSNFFEYYNLIQEIVSETKGEIMVYKDDPIEAAFHAVSVGTTRSGESAMNSEEYPYLRSVKSEKDVESKDYLYSETITYKRMSELFQKDITSMPEIMVEDELGYVEKVKINNEIISGEKFKKTLSLPSACLEMKISSSGVKITTIGKGHGLGLSQYGANEMAKEGKNYKQILNYYYQNISIVNE